MQSSMVLSVLKGILGRMGTGAEGFGRRREVLGRLNRDALVDRVIELENEVLRMKADGKGARAGPGKGQKIKAGRQVSFDRNILIGLKIAYIGWMFEGFASQPTRINTVEETLLGALKRTKLVEESATMADVDWSRGGRTDIGVSAVGNVVGVRVRSVEGKEMMDYARILNGVLPDGIRVLAWAKGVERNIAVEHRRSLSHGRQFDARIDALSRTYKYYFLGARMNIGKMQEAASYFVGRHDFRNFCRIDPANGNSNFQREMLEVEIQPVEDQGILPGGSDGSPLFELVVKGHAFLWHQIRCMAAVLFSVGEGREEPSIVSQLLDISDGNFANGKPIYRMASEVPLVLHNIEYPKGAINFEVYMAQEGMLKKKLDDHFLEMGLRLWMKAMITNQFLMALSPIVVDGKGRWSSYRHLASANPFLLDVDMEKQPLRKRQRQASVVDKLEMFNLKQLRKINAAKESDSSKKIG